MSKATFKSMGEGLSNFFKEMWTVPILPERSVEDAYESLQAAIEERIDREVNERLVAMGMIEENGILLIPTAHEAYEAVEATLRAFESNPPGDDRQQMDAAIYAAGMKNALVQVQKVVDGTEYRSVPLPTFVNQS